LQGKGREAKGERRIKREVARVGKGWGGRG